MPSARRLTALSFWERLPLPRSASSTLRGVTWPLCLLTALGAALLVLHGSGLGQHGRVIGSAASMAGAWVVLRLAASMIRNAFLARVVSLAAWTVAALHIVGLLGPTAALLDAAGFKVGNGRLSALMLVKGAFLLTGLLWFASVLSDLVENRLERSRDLSPSGKVLVGKVVRYASFSAAVFAAVNSTGIDLTALAVFTGALGVGIGFGLQKPASNLVSGLILLLDRSIKPGDVIELQSGPGGAAYGMVSRMGARYTEVASHDGKSYLIPNEEFLTSRVINWSHRSSAVRRKVLFDVSRDSDPDLVIQIAEEAAAGTRRVMAGERPLCRMSSFRGHALEFSLWFWVADPENGLANVTGDVLLALWKALRANGVEVPDPVQRVVLADERRDARPVLEPPVTANDPR